MPGKRTNTPPAWSKPPVHPTVEECDEALKNPRLTRTEQNEWLDARNEVTRAMEINARLELKQAEAA
jgi:hypothetical protein